MTANDRLLHFIAELSKVKRAERRGRLSLKCSLSASGQAAAEPAIAPNVACKLQRKFATDPGRARLRSRRTPRRTSILRLPTQFE